MSRLELFLSQSRHEYSRMRLGLHRMREILEKRGHPEAFFPSVLIAGTNGKGSTARMVESVLRRSGYRTGLYTSPHLTRFSERIVLAGQEVNSEVLDAVLDDLAVQGLLADDGTIPTTEGEPLTWFEKATLLAFEVFRRDKIEIAVLEVGLGGRMDATNVVEPWVSAITSIGFDHIEVLGPTLRDIAGEKAGVMRTGRPVVLGEMDPEIREFLRGEAERVGAVPILTDRAQGESSDFSYLNYSNLTLPLLGNHQLRNAATAIEIAKALAADGFVIPEAALSTGLKEVRHPGRLEWFPGNPPILFDGAHNSEALSSLVDYLRSRWPGRPVSVVLGMMREKDATTALRMLRTLGTKFFLTEVANLRSLREAEWKELCQNEGVTGTFFTDPRRAMEWARRQSPPEGVVLVTGSLYLVAELRLALVG